MKIKANTLLGYAVTGVKAVFVSVCVYIPLFVLGLAGVLLTVLTGGLGSILFILILPASLILWGYIAGKLWKWR